jgi:hypothetical protein
MTWDRKIEWMRLYARAIQRFQLRQQKISPLNLAPLSFGEDARLIEDHALFNEWCKLERRVRRLAERMTMLSLSPRCA